MSLLEAVKIQNKAYISLFSFNDYFLSFRRILNYLLKLFLIGLQLSLNPSFFWRAFNGKLAVRS